MKNEKLLNAIGEIDDDLISCATRDTKKRKAWLKWGSMAAILILGAGLGFFGARILNNGVSGRSLPGNNTPGSDVQIAENPDSRQTAPGSENDNEGPLVAANSIVILDVNPSISMTVDTDERIVSAEGLNEEGQAVLSGMDLTGADITVAVNAVIGSLLQRGYLSDLQNAILVSVENEDAEKSAALQERVSSLIGSAFQDGSLEGAVLSQTINDSAALEQMAQNYHISLGKAALIQEVMSQDASLTVESLVPLSITEIALISQSKNIISTSLTQSGTASDRAYISRESAVELALDHAKVNAENAVGIEVEFDSDDGIMVYEVEFYAGTVKYECDIDARTGQVVKYGAENKGAANQGGASGQSPSDVLPPSGQCIGEEAAREAALTNAGISEDTVDYINAWLKYDDGFPEHYEVEFAVGNVQYKYEIDPYSGMVLEQETENHGGYHTNDPWNGASRPGGTNSSVDIGTDAAIAAALSHANLTASQATRLKTDFDYDHGVAVYEIEFEYNGYEYEYKIDAATGNVLEYEVDD